MPEDERKRRPKRATQVILPEKEREELVQFTRRHRSEQQQAQRARMIFASAQGDSNAHIARELRINVDTVRLWRDRWVGFQGIDLDTSVSQSAYKMRPDQEAAQVHSATTLSDGCPGMRSADEG